MDRRRHFRRADPRADPPADGLAGDASAREMKLNGTLPRRAWRRATHLPRDRDSIIYTLLLVGALLLPTIANFTLGSQAGVLLDQASSAGVFVLLAIGL